MSHFPQRILLLMRLFLAVEIPETIKNKLYQQITPLRRDYPQLTWVAPEYYHITMQFFGEVSNTKELIGKIQDILYDAPAFSLFSLGTGLFIDRKITVYADFQREKKIEELVEKVRSTIATTNESSKSYKYIPHLTLARYKIPSKQQYLLMKKKLEQFEIDLEFFVDHVTLYQSVLEAQAPVYKKIFEFPLIKE